MMTRGTIAEYWLGEGHSTASTAYDNLMSVLLLVWVAGVVFFVAYLLIALLRRGDGGQSDHRSSRLLSWAPRFGVLTIAIVILVYAFQSGVKGYLETTIAPINALDLTITAKQWEWSVELPDGAKPNEFAQFPGDALGSQTPIIPIPVNRSVRLLLSSDDSFHSILIPDFRFKIGVISNRITTGTFTATTPTPPSELGHIVYCGEHAQMIAFIKVVPEAEFDRWLLGGGRPSAPVSLAQRGKAIYFQKGCIACHSTTGAVSVGPTWKGLFGSERRFTDGSSAIVDEAYLRESINSAGARVVEGFVNQMPQYAGLIPDEDVDAIIEYIKSLKDTP